jgi:hypothetical protein
VKYFHLETAAELLNVAHLRNVTLSVKEVPAVLLVSMMLPVAGRSLHQILILAVNQTKFVVRLKLATAAACLVLVVVRLAKCRQNMILFGLNARTQAVLIRVMSSVTMRVKAILAAPITEDLGATTGIVSLYLRRRPVWLLRRQI